jgi:hypothetical protein
MSQDNVKLAEAINLSDLAAHLLFAAEDTLLRSSDRYIFLSLRTWAGFACKVGYAN